MRDYSICYKVNDEMLYQMIELDKLVYNYGNIGDFKLCKNWLSKNEDIYTVLLDGDQVVGYINFMPIKKNSYFEYRAGKLKDYQITSDDIESFEDDKDDYGLICSLVLSEKLRKSNMSLKLYQGFINKIKSLKSRGITFKSVLCECVTDDGLNNAKKLGFIQVNPIDEIYEGKLDFK